MSLRTVSVQVGQPTDRPTAEGPLRTAMVKDRVAGPIQLGTRALEGDGCANLKYHGHEDQASCVYPAEHFPRLAEALSLPPFPPVGGRFSEFVLNDVAPNNCSSKKSRQMRRGDMVI